MILAATWDPASKRNRRKKSKPNLAIAYVRVSTEEQHFGPEAQRAAIESYAKSKGLTLGAIFTETVSGGAPLDERPVLWEAIEAAKERRAGVFLVAKRDRLARDACTSLLLERDLETAGVHIDSADGSGNGQGPEDKLLRTMLSAIAEYERSLIRARTKAALAAKVRRGERSAGSIPFGQRLAHDGVHLEDHPAEQAVIRRVVEAHRRGLSLRAIAAELADTPGRGAKWNPPTIARILARAE